MKNSRPFPEETLRPLSGETGDRSLDYFVNEIRQSLHATTEDVFLTAGLCAEAANQFASGSLSKLARELEMNKGQLKKYLEIAHNKEFHTEPLRSLLPSGYTILYEICRLSPVQLATAIERGAIQPNMKREDLRSYLPEIKRRRKKKRLTTIVLDGDLGPDQVKEVQKRLKQLITELRAIAMESSDPDWNYRCTRRVDGGGVHIGNVSA